MSHKRNDIPLAHRVIKDAIRRGKFEKAESVVNSIGGRAAFLSVIQRGGYISTTNLQCAEYYKDGIASRRKYFFGRRWEIHPEYLGIALRHVPEITITQRLRYMDACFLELQQQLYKHRDQTRWFIQGVDRERVLDLLTTIHDTANDEDKETIKNMYRLQYEYIRENYRSNQVE